MQRPPGSGRNDGQNAKVNNSPREIVETLPANVVSQKPSIILEISATSQDLLTTCMSATANAPCSGVAVSEGPHEAVSGVAHLKSGFAICAGTGTVVG